jgi:glycerol dehydrogenase
MSQESDLKMDYLKTGPTQYINQANILSKCGPYISKWGKRALISGGKQATLALESKLDNSLESVGMAFEKNEFTGECCKKNILEVKDKAYAFDADLIIAVGGGKAIDTAKAAADLCDIPVVAIPTIASTCAAATAISIEHSMDGALLDPIRLDTNPNLVIIDPEIIANAPSIYLKAGILDSLAKWFEGKACFKGVKDPDLFSVSAMSMAAMLYKEINENALSAVDLVGRKEVKNELVRIIDILIYFTGMIQNLAMGRIRGGIAHPIDGGLSRLKQSRDLLHGIRVGYGILVQLVMEKANDELSEMIAFHRSMGIEPTLKGFQVPTDDETISIIAESAAENIYTGALPFIVDKNSVAAAIKDLESGSVA